MIILIEPFSSRIGMYVPALPSPLMEIAGFVHQHLPDQVIKIVSLPLEYGLPLNDEAQSELLQQFEMNLEQSLPRALGISCTAISQLKSTLEICRRIKTRWPRIFTFVGGYTPSVYAEEMLAMSETVDLVICGEGELPTLAIAKSIRESGEVNPEKIPGAIWKDGELLRKGIAAERFSLSARAPLPISLLYGDSGAGILPYGFSRGCPFSCNFCMESHIRNRHFKAPPEIVERDLKEIADTGAIHTILSTDALFAGEPYLPTLRKFGLKVHFEVRCDTQKPEILAKYADVCGMIAVGLESASYDTLRRMNKVKNRSHYKKYIRGAEENIRTAIEHDIPTAVFMIAGYPGDTKADLDESLNFVKRVSQEKGQGGVVFRMGECHAYPRTTVYEQAKSLPGIEFDDDGIFGQNTVRKSSPGVDFDIIQSYAGQVLFHSHLTDKLKTELRHLLPFFRIQPEAFEDPAVPAECFNDAQRQSLNISTSSLETWRGYLKSKKAITPKIWPGERKQRELPI
ncbi:MAG: B12-binding domain-containing radical SAM protein [Proteobacteria bacterium]|nr:B12-binding domain-containing radical SAM protein [Pseudomonadota bacterium]